MWIIDSLPLFCFRTNSLVLFKWRSDLKYKRNDQSKKIEVLKVSECHSLNIKGLITYRFQIKHIRSIPIHKKSRKYAVRKISIHFVSFFYAKYTYQKLKEYVALVPILWTARKCLLHGKSTQNISKVYEPRICFFCLWYKIHNYDA